MASREERFQRRIRGAGVRQLVDDDFGFALPGVEPSLTSGTAAQRVKKATPKSRPSSGRRSTNRRQVDTLPGVAVEERATQVDQDGNTSKKQRIFLGPREPEIVSADVRSEAQQTSPSNLQISADGKRRKKRKSAGQQSRSKKRESQDLDDTILEVEELKASRQETSTSRLDEVENLEKEATKVLEQPAEHDGLPSVALAVEGVEQELRPHSSSGGDERIVHNGSASAKSRTKGSQSLSPPGDKAEANDQRLSIPGRLSQLHTDTIGTSKNTTDDCEDAVILAGLSSNELSTDIAVKGRDKPLMEQVKAGRSDIKTAALETPLLNSNKQQADDEPDTSHTSHESSSESDTSVIIDQSRMAAAKQPTSIGMYKKDFVLAAVESSQLTQDASKKRGRPRKKLFAIEKQPGRTPTLETDKPARSTKSGISTSKARGRTANTAVVVVEPNTNSSKSYGDDGISDVPREKQNLKRHGEIKPSGPSTNTVQFPTHSITEADFLPPSLYDKATLSSRMPPLVPNEYASKPNPTAADVLAQASFEIIESLVTKVRNEVTHGGMEAATSQRIRSMVQAFGREIRDRLRDMSRLMSQNVILARRVKHSRQARKEIISEIMELRKERTELDDKHFQWSGKLNLAREIRTSDERITELLQGVAGAVESGKLHGTAGEEMVGVEFFRKTSLSSPVDV